MITASTASESPSLARIAFTVASRSAFEHVLHFHRLDDAELLSRLDLLPNLDGDRLDEARHRAKQEARAVGALALDHQRRELRLAAGIDARVDADPGMGERIAVEDRAHLHGDVGAVDGSAP